MNEWGDPFEQGWSNRVASHSKTPRDDGASVSLKLLCFIWDRKLIVSLSYCLDAMNR